MVFFIIFSLLMSQLEFRTSNEAASANPAKGLVVGSPAIGNCRGTGESQETPLINELDQ